MRVLVVAPDFPFPPIGGGQVRTYRLLEALTARHEVTLVGFTWGDEPVAATLPLEVFPVPWQWPPLYVDMKCAEGEVSARAYHRLAHEVSEPWIVSCYESAEMEGVLASLVDGGYDCVVIEHSLMGRFLPSLPAHVPRILDLPDVHTRKARRSAGAQRGDQDDQEFNEAERILRFERWVASQCDITVTVSQQEAEAAGELFALKRVEVVPNGVDTSYFRPADDATRENYLLYTGLMSYEPNVEAVVYFVGEVLPLIRQRLPDATLHIVGAKPDGAVLKLASDRAVVHGFVPDTRPFFRDATVVVVPLLEGGGTRLKILEAAACAKGIVSTSVGAEGLDFEHGRELLIADSAADFSKAVIRLCADEGLRKDLGNAARRAAMTFDWGQAAGKFVQIVESCSLQARRQATR
jgi:polysaccharide biosynthesis protein PslH